MCDGMPCVFVFQERDRYAYKIHLPETVEQLRKFNARRKLKVKLTFSTIWLDIGSPKLATDFLQLYMCCKTVRVYILVFRVLCWQQSPATSSARSMVTHLRSCQTSLKIPPHLVLIYQDTVYCAFVLARLINSIMMFVCFFTQIPYKTECKFYLLKNVSSTGVIERQTNCIKANV